MKTIFDRVYLLYCTLSSTNGYCDFYGLWNTKPLHVRNINVVKSARGAGETDDCCFPVRWNKSGQVGDKIFRRVLCVVLVFCPNRTITRRVLCWNEKRPETTDWWGGEVRFLPLASRADLNPRRYSFGRVIYYPVPVDTAFFLYLSSDSVHWPVRGLSPQKRSAPTTV